MISTGPQARVTVAELEAKVSLVLEDHFLREYFQSEAPNTSGREIVVSLTSFPMEGVRQNTCLSLERGHCLNTTKQFSDTSWVSYKFYSILTWSTRKMMQHF